MAVAAFDALSPEELLGSLHPAHNRAADIANRTDLMIGPYLVPKPGSIQKCKVGFGSLKLEDSSLKRRCQRKESWLDPADGRPGALTRRGASRLVNLFPPGGGTRPTGFNLQTRISSPVFSVALRETPAFTTRHLPPPRTGCIGSPARPVGRFCAGMCQELFIGRTEPSGTTESSVKPGEPIPGCSQSGRRRRSHHR